MSTMMETPPLPAATNLGAAAETLAPLAARGVIASVRAVDVATEQLHNRPGAHNTRERTYKCDMTAPT